jgi:hypothetical protein
VALDGAVRLGIGVDAGVVDDGADRSEGVDGVGQATGLVESGEIADDDVSAAVTQQVECVRPLLVAGVDDDLVPGSESVSAAARPRPVVEPVTRMRVTTIPAPCQSAQWMGRLRRRVLRPTSRGRGVGRRLGKTPIGIRPTLIERLTGFLGKDW